MPPLTNTPPTDDLYRAITPGVTVRDADGDGPVTLDITFARFNAWNEIDSMFEGHFMERVAPGAFSKTLDERGDRVKVLFNHGHDVLGDIPIGRSVDISEEKIGPVGEVELFDSPDVARLLPALRAGVLGASYRFKVLQEELDQEPEPADHNPAGLPERTIKEVQLFEFGPVTWPADEGTSIGVRSITDRYRKPSDGFRIMMDSGISATDTIAHFTNSHPLTSTTAGVNATVTDTEPGTRDDEPPSHSPSLTPEQVYARTADWT